MAEKQNAVIKVIKYIGAVIGTTLALITLLTFFFAPIRADLDSLKTDVKEVKQKQTLIETRQLELIGDQKAHAQLHGHPVADNSIDELRQDVTEIIGNLDRAMSDIDRIANRQQTQINQVADLRAEVGVIRHNQNNP